MLFSSAILASGFSLLALFTQATDSASPLRHVSPEPVARRALDNSTSRTLDSKLCNGHGWYVQLDPAFCDCFHGWTGIRCGHRLQARSNSSRSPSPRVAFSILAVGNAAILKEALIETIPRLAKEYLSDYPADIVVFYDSHLLTGQHNRLNKAKSAVRDATNGKSSVHM